MKSKTNTVKNSIVRVALITAGLLMIPIVGKQVGGGWNWTLSDFIIAGALIFITALIIEFVRHAVRNNVQRIAFIAIILLGFVYIWAELAVGIFTNWGS